MPRLLALAILLASPTDDREGGGLPMSGGTITAGGSVCLEGTTDDANEVCISGGDPTSDWTVTLPNATGTVPVNPNDSVVSSCTGDVTCWDSNGLIGGHVTSDTAPQGLMIRAQPAFAGGTQTAANRVECPGQDETKVAIDGADPSVTCAGDNDTVTVTVINSNGSSTATVLTEGTDWTASASVSDTCTSLATAINALAGVGASCTSPDVRLTLDTTTCRVTLAESTAGCTTVTTGTPGSLFVAGDIIVSHATGPMLENAGPTSSNPVIIPDRAAPTAGIGGGGGTLEFLTSAGVRFSISVGGIVTFNTRTTYATSTLTLAAAATTAALSTNSHTMDCDGGNNNVTTLTNGTGTMFVILKFVDSNCIFVDDATGTANTIDIGAAFTSSDNDTLTLYYDGTSWHELSRSVN